MFKCGFEDFKLRLELHLKSPFNFDYFQRVEYMLSKVNLLILLALNFTNNPQRRRYIDNSLLVYPFTIKFLFPLPYLSFSCSHFDFTFN